VPRDAGHGPHPSDRVRAGQIFRKPFASLAAGRDEQPGVQEVCAHLLPVAREHGARHRPRVPAPIRILPFEQHAPCTARAVMRRCHHAERPAQAQRRRIGIARRRIEQAFARQAEASGQRRRLFRLALRSGQHRAKHVRCRAFGWRVRNVPAVRPILRHLHHRDGRRSESAGCLRHLGRGVTPSRVVVGPHRHRTSRQRGPLRESDRPRAALPGHGHMLGEQRRRGVRGLLALHHQHRRVRPRGEPVESIKRTRRGRPFQCQPRLPRSVPKVSGRTSLPPVRRSKRHAANSGRPSASR